MLSFENICSVFPNNVKDWPCPKPSKALPVCIRGHIRDCFGGIVAAHDLNKQNSPSRMGTSTRAFELGDPISTLSKNHYIKTQELLTRIDNSLGRQRALLIFHCYSNMLYHSEHSLINKGQLAIGVIALLEEIHLSLSHSFDVIGVKSENLFSACSLHSKKIKNSDYIYVISDLLYDNQTNFSAADDALNIYNYFHIKKSIFFIVRDPLEYPKESKTEFSHEELIPFNEIEHKKSQFFSGKKYYENSIEQFEYFEKKMQNKNNHVKIIIAQDSIESFTQFILNDYLRKK